MSTYVLGSDDPDTVRRFADEVAPAVRELVQAERARRASAPAGSRSASGPPAGTRPTAPTRRHAPRSGEPGLPRDPARRAADA